MRRVQVYDGEGDAALDVLVVSQIEADWLSDYLEGLEAGDVYVDTPPAARLPALLAADAPRSTEGEPR